MKKRAMLICGTFWTWMKLWWPKKTRVMLDFETFESRIPHFLHSSELHFFRRFQMIGLIRSSFKIQTVDGIFRPIFFHWFTFLVRLVIYKVIYALHQYLDVHSLNNRQSDKILLITRSPSFVHLWENYFACLHMTWATLSLEIWSLHWGSLTEVTSLD